MAKFKTGVVILLSLIVLSLLFASVPRIDMDLYLEKPGIDHIFGCDSLGRDLFSLSLYGFSVSLLISFISTLFSLLIAFVLLLLMRAGGVVRTVVYSFVKAVRTVPVIILSLFLLSFPGNGGVRLVFSLSIQSGVCLALLLFPLMEGIESEDYIIAERSLGIREDRLFRRHIVPRLMPISLENSTESFLLSVLTESSLSFLGLGLDPAVPTLGRIIASSRGFFLSFPHTLLGPGIILLLFASSVLLIKSGLSELYSSSHGSR